VTGRLRALITLARPPVLLLGALFCVAGFAQGGGSGGGLRLIAPLVVVAGYLLCSVIINDLADEAIDRVNLPGAASRPLVTGAASRDELPPMAAAAGVLAVAAAATIGWAVVAVLAAGLLLSVAYSLPPVRLSSRGAVASLLLPAGYVAVPYLTGLLAVGRGVTGADLLFLAGLYVGFIGRILLKDFRDVRGDALFGKRTFLVRHGRRWTCAGSALGWTLGSVAILGVRRPTVALAAVQVVLIAAALVLLRALAADRGRRGDDALISAIAILGRGSLVTVIAHLSTVDAGWSAGAATALVAAIAVLALGQATTMARWGPASRLRVPPGWAAEDRRAGAHR
jgi:4-hydroxybenzoate polyprenyltransferase